MVVDAKAPFLGDCFLAFFDFSVVELFNVTALQADQMVMVAAPVEFVDGFAGFEMVAHQQPGLLELCEHAIYGGQAGISAFLDQFFINIFRGQMAYRARHFNYFKGFEQ